MGVGEPVAPLFKEGNPEKLKPIQCISFFNSPRFSLHVLCASRNASCKSSQTKVTHCHNT